MRILLSAYACEPGKGSEPGVGWNWANELARQGHEVSVLTRANNRPSIERALATVEPGVRFYYYDLPVSLGWWKKGKRGIRLYYLLWQWGAYRLARRLHAESPFDLVHHITFGVLRHPSFMGKLGIPFVFGPLGGGERTPPKLRKELSIRARTIEALRDLANMWASVDPLMRRTYSRARLIVAKTEESRAAIPRAFQDKTRVCLEIGLPFLPRSSPPASVPRAASLRLLYAGRFIYWKGMHIGLLALARAGRHVPDVRLTMVGTGPEEQEWRKLAQQLGIDDRIDWISWLPQEELMKQYLAHDAFLFPSLHDSSGNVVLEAMAHGLPVLCLALGGPGSIVTKACGYAVAADNRDTMAVVEELASCIVQLTTDPARRVELAKGAHAVAAIYSWQRAITQVYGHLEQTLPRLAGLASQRI